MGMYEDHKEVWDGLAATGFSSLVELAKMFPRCTELGAALGMSQAAVSHWQLGRCRPSMPVEYKAREVLKSLKKPFSFADAHPAQAILPIDPPQAPPASKQVEDASGVLMLLVVCPSAAAAKVQKILGFLGCEVTEV